VTRVAALPPEPPPGVHAAQWFAQGATALGATSTPTPQPLIASPDEDTVAVEWARRLPRHFLALHPGSGSPTKNWSPFGFAALAEALAPGVPLALVSGPADDAAGAALARLLPRAVRLEGLPLPVLGAVLSRAALYVGNDSGVSHLAAAFGAPTLALFGATDPVVWAPLGPRVVALRAPQGELARLEAPPVIEAALRLRSEAPARPVG
jgi:ADP-heptose:LPS heptosyltransferase